ncbi:MAG TPA: IS21-like element helper ATPase IstB [Stellaceae bacterium]|nr:IS21-like element helper ATPase IstB [Stellaceae bacterium]
MAYAKLSGALLVRKDAPITEAVSVPRIPAAASPPPAAVAVTAAPDPAPAAALPVAAPPPPHIALPATAADAEKLLADHLKALKLPTFLSQYATLAEQCAAEGLDPSHYLLRLAELELGERQRQVTERRIKAARFPAVKELDGFDFAAVPTLDQEAIRELANCDYIARNENIIAVGNSGTGKTHLAIGLGVEACRKGVSVRFITAASLVHELLEASDERRLLRLQRRLASYRLLIIDELAYAPLSAVGADLLFDVVSQRYERGSTIITSSLPFEEWISVFGTAQLTGAVLDRLVHYAHILEVRGESYRLKQSRLQLHGRELGRETQLAQLSSG